MITNAGGNNGKAAAAAHSKKFLKVCVKTLGFFNVFYRHLFVSLKFLFVFLGSFCFFSEKKNGICAKMLVHFVSQNWPMLGSNFDLDSFL